MEFRVVNGKYRPETADGWSRVGLEIDDWDDYGFQTMFDLVIYTNTGTRVAIGKVKILERGQTTGRPSLPPSFESLPQDLISLGQDHDYYEALGRLGRSVYEPVLKSLNDIVFAPELRTEFEEEPGFRTSLLRFGSAQSAMETAQSLFDSTIDAMPAVVKLSVETSVGGSTFSADFEWDTTSTLPGHLAALIGYNGTGKTQLLANLGFIAATTGASLYRGNSERFGKVISNTIDTFAGVIAVSYSAFDTFPLPQFSDELTRVDETGSSFGYVYIGLRRPIIHPEALPDAPVEYELTSPAELVDDFRRALQRARSKERFAALAEVLAILLREPSFSMGGLTEDSLSNVGRAVALFERLSTGHKIVLNIVVRLIGQLQPRTLVLIDEPESHLHPPLIAALLAALSVAVRRQESVAILATHSPVVLQEIPARHVRVLRRSGAFTRVEQLDTETFAENVGYLTRTVFNLDSAATDFQRVLRRLLETRSHSDIEALFPLGLSQQGRAILAALELAADDDAPT